MREKGQALVLVLLSLAVVLTVVLSVFSRSITDVSISSKENDALRAFSAAEAGIEKALVVGSSSGAPVTIGDASYVTVVGAEAEGKKVFNYPFGLSSGEDATLWFVSHNSAGSMVCGTQPCFTGRWLKFCWGEPGTVAETSTTPAVELTIYYVTSPLDYTTSRIARATFDPNSGRRFINNFDPLTSTNDCTIGNEKYQFQATIPNLGSLNIVYNNPGNLLFAKARLLYNTDTSHKIGFSVNNAANSTLPSQGMRIDSSGTAGDANRRLDVFQGFGEAPGIFEYAVFSPDGLVK